MYDSQTLVNNIKNQAKKKNILIRDMLSDCGLSINAISQISDKKGLSSFSLAKIADYLDCSVDFLLGRASQSSSNSDLSDTEQQLLNYFRNLNEHGKKYVLQSALAATALYPAEQRYQMAALKGHGIKSGAVQKNKEDNSSD